MTPEKRQPYRDKVNKVYKLLLESQGHSKSAEEPRLQQVKGNGPEKHQRNMQQQIENIVRRSRQLKKLVTEHYYFIMVNYFVKDIYIPAELAIAQFSLQGGVHRIFHTLINPGILKTQLLHSRITNQTCNFLGCYVYGSLCEAQEHSKDTHQLPLPPDALGNTDLEGVYADVLQFLGPGTAHLFTLQDAIPIVTGVLKFLNTESSRLNILPIEYLFYKMKEASCKTVMLSPPASIHEANSLFNMDPHECLSHIACTFHEKSEVPKHCAKSYVTRWAFTFARNICSDLAIKMCPNRHMPETSTANPSENENVDHETCVIKVEPFVDPINLFVVNAINDLGLDSIFDDEDFFNFNKRYSEKETEASIKTKTVNVDPEQSNPKPLVEELSAPAPPVITAQELNDKCKPFSRKRKRQLKHKDKKNSKNEECQESCTSNPDKLMLASRISKTLHDTSIKKEEDLLNKNSKNFCDSNSRIDDKHRSRKRTKASTEIDTISTAHLSNPTMSKKLSTIVTTGANLLRSPSHPRPISPLCNYTYNTYHYESFTTYECRFEPQSYFEPQHCDQYDYQPIRRHNDLRHRLQMRSHVLPQDAFDYRIQRRYDLESGQMHTYSNEQFQMRRHNTSAWDDYEYRYQYQNYYYNGYD